MGVLIYLSKFRGQIVPQLTPSVMLEIERLLANKPQRPPMVSTLAMRNQQNNTVRIDMP